jgi:hypothetical protein
MQFRLFGNVECHNLSGLKLDMGLRLSFIYKVELTF